MSKHAHVAAAALAIVLLGAPASAQTKSGDMTPPAKPKKTCRSLTPTGSFLPTRVCNTEAEWARFDGVTQQGVTDFRRALNMTATNEHSQRN